MRNSRRRAAGGSATSKRAATYGMIAAVYSPSTPGGKAPAPHYIGDAPTLALNCKSLFENRGCGLPAPLERDVVLHLPPIRRVPPHLLSVRVFGPVDHARPLVRLVELAFPLLRRAAGLLFPVSIHLRRV